MSSSMVNDSYCESLTGFFSEMAFYGILKNEDAQCFSIESSIEEGFFVLAVGAILLALVNTFVTKAMRQYFRDESELYRKRQTEIIEVHASSRLSSAEEGQEGEETNTSSETAIRPVPVLFTDTFRWLLRQRDDTAECVSRDSSSCSPNSSSDQDSNDIQAPDYCSDQDSSIQDSQI